MTKVIKFKTAYGDRTRKGFETTGDSLTQQSHAAAADVRYIIKQYDRTGLIANVNKGIAQYGDYSSVNEYAEALNMVREANESFAQIKQMKYRKKMPKAKSKKLFTKRAMAVQPNNFAKPMRGGIRL